MVAVTDGYSAVFVATAVILVNASIVGATLLRGNTAGTARNGTAPADDARSALSHV